MGSRLSAPRGVAGMTEASYPTNSGRSRFSSRQLIAPMAAFTMAGLLFVYARTSIRAAKANAQRHRNADSGGQGLNLLAESRRRHGLDASIGPSSTIGELAQQAKQQLTGQSEANAQVASTVSGQARQPDAFRAALDKAGASK